MALGVAGFGLSAGTGCNNETSSSGSGGGLAHGSGGGASTTAQGSGGDSSANNGSSSSQGYGGGETCAPGECNQQLVAAGHEHTCAITSDESVKCIGSNTHGELGIGTTKGASSFVPVSSLGSGVIAITASLRHTCALTRSGDVQCWGQNDVGQVGDGSTSDRLEPVPPAGLGSGNRSLSAGYSHTCVVTSAGGVKCWGDNTYGQLGNDSDIPSSEPVDVTGLDEGIAAVSAGVSHTCAVTTAGAIWCWGDNTSGQFGNGTVKNSATPAPSSFDTDVLSVAAGNASTCATTASGLQCWGQNMYGQLGMGSEDGSLLPTSVLGLGPGALAAGMGLAHVCGIAAGGALKCSGYNDFGQLGDGSYSHSDTPVDVSGLDAGVLAVAAGNAHTCAALAGGDLKCWGYMLNNSSIDSTTPAAVSGW